MNRGLREIRARYDDETITVYQAYNKSIAESAVAKQAFVSPPFKVERMTWIKPSFLWMMYRSGWGQKENQEHILAIQIKREGFEWALANSCLSHFDALVYPTHETWKEKLANSPVRIQWDPEKDIYFNPLAIKSIQIGLSGAAVPLYVNDWIVGIEDITDHCRRISNLLENDVDAALALLPKEEVYPVPPELHTIIHLSKL